MAFKLCGIEEKFLRDGTPRDNRVAWSQVLQGSIVDVNDQLETLLPMLYIYLCAVDSTCGVERDLGALTRVLQAHKGPIDTDGTTVAYCTEVLLDGPTDESGLALHASGGGVDSSLLPTDLVRECAALWVKLHGRRFRVYQHGRKPGPKRPRSGTMSEVKRKVTLGMDTLVSRCAPADDTPTILGLARTSFRRSGDNPAMGKGLLGRFDALTKSKHEDHIKLLCARRSRQNPYADVAFNPRHTLRRGNVLRGRGDALPSHAPTLKARPGHQRIVVMSCCREPLAARSGYVVKGLDTRCTADQLLSAFRRSDVVAFDSTWTLDQVPRLSTILTAAFFVTIALGKAALSRSSWASCPPTGPPSAAIVQFLPICTTIKQNLVLTEVFTRNHELLATVMELVARLPTSKWATTRASDAEGVKFETAGDVRNFLLRARRVHHNGRGLLGGMYFAPQSQM